MKNLMRTITATTSIAFTMLSGAAAFGSTLSKNLPAPINQAAQGATHVINEAGRPLHNAVRDVGHSLEGGHGRKTQRSYSSSVSSRNYGHVRTHHRARHHRS